MSKKEGILDLGDVTTIDPFWKHYGYYSGNIFLKPNLVERGAVLAFDTEKIMCHVDGNKTPTHVSGDFTLVDLQGRVVMQCYIFRENVCAYNTWHTGLDAEKIQSGTSHQNFIQQLRYILNNNTLVGTATKEDFKHLGLTGNNWPEGCTSYDIQSFFRDGRGQAISLPLLYEYFTGRRYPEGKHSSHLDARLTAALYNKMQDMKSRGYTFPYEEFDLFRKKLSYERELIKAYQMQRWETCKCSDDKPSPAIQEEEYPSRRRLFMIVLVVLSLAYLMMGK